MKYDTDFMPSCAQSQYCAYSHFSEMLSRTGIDWWIAVFDLEMYWDDSGTHDASPIATAACYVADKEQWSHFVRNWDEARKEEGFEYFHMKEFMAPKEAQKKPFCDWDSTKRNHVYARLASIVRTRARIGFGYSVPTAAFDKYVPDRVKKEIFPDAFTFAVHCVFGFVSEWYEKYAAGKAIQYVFEDRPGMAKVRQSWEMLKEHPDFARKLGMRIDSPDGFGFQNPKLFKPLQAADMLAWNLNVHMRDVILNGLPDAANCKPYFSQLRRRAPLQMSFMTEDQVASAFK